MCAMGKITACELSFLPISSEDYVKDVDRVIDVIKMSGLKFSVGSMSTLIQADYVSIFRLLGNIYASMDEICTFTMVVKISNLCGCAVEVPQDL